MRLEYIDQRGQALDLTASPYFKLTNADGLTAAAVDIATSTVPGMDGEIVNGAQASPRTIVLDLTIEGPAVETAKRAILRIIKPKQSCVLRMEQEGRALTIGGVVEQIEMPRFSALAIMQVTIRCPQPWWEDEDQTQTEISEVLNLHYFTDYEDDQLAFLEEGQAFGEYDTNRTKVFENDGDAEVALRIDITALGEVTNPAIYNSKAQFIGVNLTLHAGDQVTITTGKGEKAILLNGENRISALMPGSTWLTLPTGEEELTIDSEDGTEGNMYFTVTYRRRYV